MRKRIHCSALLLALAMSSACGDDGESGRSSATPTPECEDCDTPTPMATPVIENLSFNLVDLEFTRFSQFPFFCNVTDLGRVVAARMSRGNDGLYRFSLTVIEPTACPRSSPGGECRDRVEIPARVLSDEERQRIVDASRAVEILPEDPRCETGFGFALDLCVQMLRWTLAVGDAASIDRVTFTASDHPCAPSRLPAPEIDRFATLFAALR